MGDLVSVLGLGRYPRGRKGYPLQYFGLENSMDCIVHGVAKSPIGLSDFHFHCQHADQMGFPFGTVVKNPPANAGDLSSIPGSGRSPGEGNGNPLQYFGLENSTDRGAIFQLILCNLYNFLSQLISYLLHLATNIRINYHQGDE